MTSQTAMEPPPGGLTFARLRAAIDLLSTALNVFGTLLILALTVLVNADVLGRELFLAPIAGVPEIVSMAIVGIVFLQVSQAFHRGRFTRTDTLLGILERKAPRVRAGFELLYCLAALALIWVLFSASLPLFESAWQRGIYIGTIGSFTAPTWPVKLIVPIGCVALMLQIIIRAILSVWGIFHADRAAEVLG